MSAASDHFLDTAVQPFADNPELQVHARRFLEENLNPAAPPDSWQDGIATLQQRDRIRWLRHGVLALLVLTVIVAVACFWKTASNFRVTHGLLDYIRGRSMVAYDTSDRNEERFYRSLDPEKRLILNGDLTRSLRSDRLESLCARHPDNPSYYTEYATAYWTDHETLPPDFLATAARIDPDNGWFPFFAAGALSKDLVENAPLTREQNRAHVPRKWNVHDEPRFQQVMALFHQAATMPGFRSYQLERLHEILGLLPPPRDAESATRRMGKIADRPSPVVLFRRLLDPVCAAAERAETPETLDTLAGDWRVITLRQVRSGSNLLDLLVAEVWAAGPIPNLRASATRLGVEQGYSQLPCLLDVLWKDREDRNSRSSAPIDDLVDSHGAILHRLTSSGIHRQVYHPPRSKAHGWNPDAVPITPWRAMPLR